MYPSSLESVDLCSLLGDNLVITFWKKLKTTDHAR